MKALVLSLAWIGSYLALARYGVHLLPASFARTLTLPTYLAGVQLLTLCLGLSSLSVLTKHDPALRRALLPLWSMSTEPEASSVVKKGRLDPLGPFFFGSLLLAPLAYSAAHSLGMWLAFDTLIAELAEKGRQVVQQQTGELGRQAKVDSLTTLFPFTVLIAPVGEEVLFRGALFGAYLQAFQTKNADVLPATPSRFLTWLRGPVGAVLFTTFVFGLLHADTPGGLGILRVTSASFLGFSCAVLRTTSGGLVAPVALHAGYNFLSLGTLRGWFTTLSWPTKFGLPTLLLPAALIGLLVFMILFSTDRALGKGRTTQRSDA